MHDYKKKFMWSYLVVLLIMVFSYIMILNDIILI